MLKHALSIQHKFVPTTEYFFLSNLNYHIFYMVIKIKDFHKKIAIYMFADAGA